MRMLSILVIFTALLASISKTHALDERLVSAEQGAYERLLSYIVKVRNHEKDIEYSQWQNNLQFLISTPSLEGDKYLASLAFFDTDAHQSEDFSCALERRFVKHKDTFIKTLKETQEQFDQQNPCQTYNQNRPNRAAFLRCRSKEDFTSFVTAWIAELEMPDENPEVDCSEVFQ